MKIILAFFLAILGASLGAEGLERSRTLLQFGTLLTKGDDSSWDQVGVGLTFRNYNFFDPGNPDGWYFGILGSALTRSAGGVELADTRLVTLGWRGNPLVALGDSTGPVQLDVNLSPTIGSRIQGSSVLGSGYTGVGLTLGLGFPLFEGQDVGLSWEPVFPVTSWGERKAPNRGYSDFVLSWTIKSFTESKSLPWSSRG